MAAVPPVFTVGKLVTDSTQPGDGTGVIIRVEGGEVDVLFLEKLMRDNIPLNELARRARLGTDNTAYVRKISTNQLILAGGSLSPETAASYRGQILSQVSAAPVAGAAAAAAPLGAQITFLSKVQEYITDKLKSCAVITAMGLAGLLYLYLERLELQRLGRMAPSEVLLEGALEGIANLLIPTDGASCSVMGGGKRKRKSKKVSKRRKHRKSRRF